MLLVNTLYFSGYSVFADEFAGLPDRIANQGIYLLAQQKFVTIFSFLFGVGFVLQMKRAEAKGRSFNGFFLRRLVVLLGIALAHALLDPSEVLHQYVLLGLLLLLLRGVHTRVLLGLAIFLAACPYVLSLVAPSVARFPPTSPQVYTEGRLGEVVAFHVGQFVSNRASWVSYVWMFSAFAPFAFGAYAGRQEVFERIDAMLPGVRRLGWWGLGVGIAGTLGAVWTFRSGLPHGFVAGGLVWTLGVWGLALFYMVRVAVVAQSRRLPALSTWFGAVGRLTLTNFVMQTVICTSLFYAYGLGLYGAVGPAACVGLTIVIYALQVLASGWWIKRYRFGPLEWVWRTLTYGTVQPMQVVPVGTAAGLDRRSI